MGIEKYIKRFWYRVKQWFWHGPIYGIRFALAERKTRKVFWPALLTVVVEEGPVYLLVNLDVDFTDEQIRAMHISTKPGFEEFLTEIKNQAKENGWDIVKIEKFV